MYFLGYIEQSKAYKIYNPVTKKFVLSRDVKFFENKSWSNQVDEASNQSFYPPQPSRLQVEEEPYHYENGTSSNSESTSDLTSLKDNQKTRSVTEIYE